MKFVSLISLLGGLGHAVGFGEAGVEAGESKSRPEDSHTYMWEWTCKARSKRTEGTRGTNVLTYMYRVFNITIMRSHLYY